MNANYSTTSASLTSYTGVIAEGNLENFNKAFEKVAKKLVKAGFTPVSSVRILTELVKFGPLLEVRTSYEVTLGGMPSLRIAGWEFIGKKTYLGEGVYLCKSKPGSAILEEKGSSCAHCSTDRFRKTLYVFQNAEGEQMQVGSSCVGEYLGLPDGEALLEFYSGEFFARDSSSEFLGSHIRAVSFRTALASALSATDRFGFRGSREEHSTRSYCSTELFGLKGDLEKTWQERYCSARQGVMESEEFQQTLLEIEEWLVAQRGSEFLENLQKLFQANICRPADLGYLAALPQVFLKAQNRAIARAQAHVSQYVGTVGGKFLGEVTVQKEFVCDGNFGRTYGYTLLDEAGNTLHWWSSTGILREGQTVMLKGSIKGHSEFREVRQTQLTRCKVVS